MTNPNTADQASAESIKANKNCILTTTDGSELGNRAVEQANLLANKLGAELVILYVQNDASGPMEEFGRDKVTPADLKAFQASFTRDFQQQYPNARIRVEQRLGRPIHRVIVDTREDEQAKMIVMSTRGRGGLAAVTGTVADGVLSHARVPVLMIKGRQPVVEW